MVVEKSYKVWVYSPDEPKLKVQGYFSWGDETPPSLKIIHIPEPRPHFLSEARSPCLWMEGGCEGTLVDNLNVGHVSHELFDEVRLRPTFVFLNTQRRPEELKFTKLSVLNDAVERWFRISGLQMNSEPETAEYFIKIEYSNPDDMVCYVSDELTVRYFIEIRQGFSRIPTTNLSLIQKGTLILETCRAISIQEILREYRKVVGFIELAKDSPTMINQVFIADSDESSIPPVEVLANWKGKEYTNDIAHELFFFSEVKHNLREHMAKWFTMYNSIDFTLDMYREIKHASGLEMELRFFNIVSALENLHRNLYTPGKMQLIDRLKDIVAKFKGEIGDLLSESDCEQVVNSRNYLVHQHERAGKPRIPESDYFFWYRRLAMVFEICLLRQLPFEDDILDKIIQRRWKTIKSGWLGEWNV